MPTVTPQPPYDEGELLTALCIWRESRGERYEAKRGVFCVLRNRCRMSPREGFKSTLQENVLKPWAFSSFNAGDPNCDKYPASDDPSWLDCLHAVRDNGDYDSTKGAQFYFSLPLTAPPHAWGPVEITAVIGGLTFCAIRSVPVVVS